MKRLALFVASAFMALLLTACGENNNNKTDNANDTHKTQSNLNNANKEVNAELSSDANVKKADTQSQDANKSANP